MGSHNSSECKLTECDDCTEQGKSGVTTELTHNPPLPPSSVAQNHSSTGKDTAVGHLGINAPAAEVKQLYKLARSIPPPPGFKPIQAPAPAYKVPRFLAFENSVVDFIDTTGTYCYSKIWVSEEERMRINFKRAKERAHRNGFDKLPFFPQNVGEYTALVAEKEATEAERVCKKSQHNDETVQGRYNEVKMKTAAASPTQQLQHLTALKTRDGLSAVLAADTCFNEAPSAPEDDRVDWPPDSEFHSWKESRPPPGNGLRKKAYCGAWPFPRINKPFQAGETFEDGEVPYGKRQIVLAPRWDCAPKSIWVQDKGVERPACEIEMDWLSDANPMLADLLEDI